MPSELQPTLSPYDPRSAASAIRDTAALLGIDRLRVAITASRISGGTWLYTVQVVDRRGQPVKTTADIRLFVSTERGGAPGGTQTETFLSGTILYTDAVHAAWEVRTDTSGRATLSLAFASGSRYLNGGLVTQYESSDETPA